jgi:hypothetical protein
MIDWCRTYKYNIDQFNLPEFLTYSKNKEVIPNNVGWYLYENKDNFSVFTEDLRTELEKLFDNPLNYMGVWDYFPGFVDDLGPHIDRGDIENAVIFMVPEGELTVTLHNPKTKEILESKVLSGNNIMVVNHTKFMHDIQGVGKLVVFGLSKTFDDEMFFRNDGLYYRRSSLEYDVDLLYKEVMDLYPSDDKVTTFNYFPMSKGHTEYTWTFDPLPNYMRDIIEKTTNEVLVPCITYLSDFRNTGTDLDIHKDPRWNSLGRVPPKLSMVCLSAYTKICFWGGRNGTHLIDYCIYGPGDVLTFDHTEVFHSAKSLLNEHRKINMQCYSYGGEEEYFVVQYEDWKSKYKPWITEFLSTINVSLDLDKPDMVSFMTFKDYELTGVSTIEFDSGYGKVSNYGLCEGGIAHLDWAEDNEIILL